MTHVGYRLKNIEVSQLYGSRSDDGNRAVETVSTQYKCIYCDAQAPPHPSQVTELPGVATHEER